MSNLRKKDLELSISSMLGLSWKLFQEHFRIILEITLIVYIPINIGLEYIPVDWYYDADDLLRTAGNYSRITQIIEGLVGIIATMGIAIAVESILSGKKPVLSCQDVLEKTIQKWPSAIMTNIILTICVIGLALLLIVPGIIAFIYWQFAIWAVCLRGLNGTSALKYSKSLVWDRWWKVAGYTIVFTLLALMLAGAIGYVGWRLPGDVLTNVMFYTMGDIFFAFFTVLSTVFFLTLEKTKK